MSIELEEMREAIERLRLRRYPYEDDADYARRIEQAIEREQADGYADALEAHFRGLSTEALTDLVLPLLREANTPRDADQLARKVGTQQDERASFKGWHGYLTGRIKRTLDRIAVTPEEVTEATDPDGIVRYGAGVPDPGGANRNGLYYWTVAHHRRAAGEAQDKEAARVRRIEELLKAADRLGIDAHVRERYSFNAGEGAEITQTGSSISVPYAAFVDLAKRLERP